MKKSIGYRIFLVRGDEALPVTKTLFDDFVFRGRPLSPAFAGQTVDIATVVCRLQNKKPKEIIRIYCQRFKIKSDGSLDADRMRSRGGPATIGGFPNTASRKEREDANGDARSPARRLTRSLGMISHAAQKKIFDVLWR